MDSQIDFKNLEKTGFDSKGKIEDIIISSNDLKDIFIKEFIKDNGNILFKFYYKTKKLITRRKGDWFFILDDYKIYAQFISGFYPILCSPYYFQENKINFQNNKDLYNYLGVILDYEIAKQDIGKYDNFEKVIKLIQQNKEVNDFQIKTLTDKFNNFESYFKKEIQTIQDEQKLIKEETKNIKEEINLIKSQNQLFNDCMVQTQNKIIINNQNQLQQLQHQHQINQQQQTKIQPFPLSQQQQQNNNESESIKENEKETIITKKRKRKTEKDPNKTKKQKKNEKISDSPKTISKNAIKFVDVSLEIKDKYKHL